MLGYNAQELGRMNMRQFVNALNGFTDKQHETWKQARMIAWFSAFDRKPFKETDIQIPGGEVKKGNAKASQENKEDIYKLLDKWNK